MEGERQRQRECDKSPSTGSVWLSSLFLSLPSFVSLGLPLCPFLSIDSQFFFLRGYSLRDSHKLWSLEEVMLAYTGSKYRSCKLVHVAPNL